MTEVMVQYSCVPLRLDTAGAVSFWGCSSRLNNGLSPLIYITKPARKKGDWGESRIKMCGTGVQLKEQISPFLPPAVAEILALCPPALWEEAEEIRLRLERPLTVHGRHGARFYSSRGAACDSERAYHPDRRDLEQALLRVSSSSLYAFEEELRGGYLTLPGGHRVGLCGKAVLEAGRVSTLKNIASFNYRLARDVPGTARPYAPYLLHRREGRVCRTLIVSPPRGGKTTFLRDLARSLSDGLPGLGQTGFQVAVVDERSEIAGSFRGLPQLQVGRCTDVLDGCPKAEGMMMLLRSMAPQVIITDEIGRDEDGRAIEEVLHAGITIIATAHGSNLEELARRPGLARLLNMRIFERLVILGRSRGVGTVELIQDPRNGRKIYAVENNGFKREMIR